MKMRLTAFALLALLGAFVLAPVASVAAKPRSYSATVGTVTGTTATGGAFDGLFTLDHFVAQDGQLAAVGTLTGTLTDTVANVSGSVNQLVTLPVLNTSGSCQILDLTLGPLDLDLLGLQVHLDTVHLNITAQSGPGNLLGNLLCGVAHLLDSNAPASTLANLLNRLLGLLG